jgi:hypothetical protein
MIRSALDTQRESLREEAIMTKAKAKANQEDVVDD